MTATNAERDAAFEFARLLGSPTFRKALRAIGCTDVQDVVTTVEGETVGRLMDRLFTRTKSPALVAFKRAGEPATFRLIVVRAVTNVSESSTQADDWSVSSNTTVGMLFDAIHAGDHKMVDLTNRYGYSFEPVDRELIAA